MRYKFVAFKQCRNPIEAGCLKAFLEEHGIPAAYDGEDKSSVLGRYSVIARGVMLRVREGDVPRARKLLAKAPSFEATDDDLAAAEADGPIVDYFPEETGLPSACPNCGSKNIAEARPPRVIHVLLTLVLLGLPLLFSKAAWFCRDCGWEWSL